MVRYQVQCFYIEYNRCQWTRYVHVSNLEYSNSSYAGVSVVSNVHIQDGVELVDLLNDEMLWDDKPGISRELQAASP